ncbi:MAG TPA: sigma-70 family RNA polymerase sigma factor [Acidimicrobiales bacterium]|nr:sigma-70 family RNA polymerase sigma factor [Acidimicrobiales bacterium]
MRHGVDPSLRRTDVDGATSDFVLVVAVARRDQAALSELYRRHGGSLFCAALRVLSVREMAEEVVQDVFQRLWSSPERFDPARGSLRGFLLAQCHGRAVDIVRSESARRRREERDANQVTSPSHVEDDVLDFVVAEKVREAVAMLGRAEREAISLAYFGGHSYVEVASLLAIPEGTAKSRIRSGLARLSTALLARGISPRLTNARASCPPLTSLSDD